VARSKTELIANVREGEALWRDLLATVPRDRMEEPGAMGEWTFKDAVSHLAAWRGRAIERFEAAAAGAADPPPPWPVELESADDDAVNGWIHETTRGLRLDGVIAGYDAMWDRLVRALEALPERAFSDPTAFPWMDGAALGDSDFSGHLAEHADLVRGWLGAAERG
jgi:hypothetical protein